MSLDLIGQAALQRDEPFIDVGAGWSTLADHLIAQGHSDVTLVDLSQTALDVTRHRIEHASPGGADAIEFVVADILALDLGRAFAMWHDRAVFHFLTEVAERDAYRASLSRSVRPGGWLAIATFGADGPTQCSGLPIMRYSAEALAAEFPDFEVVATAGDDHQTPWGSTQQFTALLLRNTRS